MIERSRLTIVFKFILFLVQMALHEALIALQTGCSGLLTLKQDDPHFKKVQNHFHSFTLRFSGFLFIQRLPTIPYVHQGELEILDRLTQLGRHYRTLDEYVQNIIKTKTSKIKFDQKKIFFNHVYFRWFIYPKFCL
jgi:hypothetical protein